MLNICHKYRNYGAKIQQKSQYDIEFAHFMIWVMYLEKT